MKYTRQHIKDAFVKWNTEVRLHPSQFETQEDMLKLDLDEVSEKETQELIDYINK